DLDGDVVFAQMGVLDDAVGEILADQEVLAEALARREPTHGECLLHARQLGAFLRRALAYVARGPTSSRIVCVSHHRVTARPPRGTRGTPREGSSPGRTGA